MKFRLLNAQDVEAALPMATAVEVMRGAFGELSAGRVEMPQRTSVATDGGVTLLMPAYLGKRGEFGVKVVSVYGGNASRGLPVVNATVLVLDPETGLVRALLDGTSLTALRTGAAGGLATDLLARPDARTVALFGAGVQARTQLRGILAVRRITKVWLYSRTRSRAEELAAEVRTWTAAPTLTLASSPGSAVREADIVVAATTSTRPVFPGGDLRPGTHVTGVGSYTPEMQEVDEVTVGRARVVVDSRQACAAEAGDLLQAGAEIDAELGEVVNGVAPGRRSPDEITFFKSVGVAAQDAAAACAVLTRAEAEGLGRVVEL